MANGTVLKKLRLKHKISIRDMAAKFLVSESSVRSYENADKLSFERLEQYCVILEEKEILHVLNQLGELL